MSHRLLAAALLALAPTLAAAQVKSPPQPSLVIFAMVAKNHSVMTASAPTVVEFKVEGNPLWLTSKATDGQPESQTRTKLTRIR